MRLITALILTLTLTAQAAAVCAPTSEMISRMEAKWGEVPTDRGVVNNKGALVVLVNQDTGSWTIIMTMANGRSCMMATGKNWEHFEPVKAKGEPL